MNQENRNIGSPRDEEIQKLEETIESLEKTIENLRAESKDSIGKLEKSYQQKVSKLEEKYRQSQLLKDELTDERVRKIQEELFKEFMLKETKIKNSMSWKLGRMIIVPLMLIKNFLFNPVRFFTSKSYRLNGYIAEYKTSGNTFREKFQNLIMGTHIEPPDIDPRLKNAGCIMDEFTTSCFKDEFNVIAPTPYNWRNLFRNYPVDMLFVESAWLGNNGSWNYKVGKYSKYNQDDLLKLVRYCKKHDIPTVFWNKEDPVHFNKFISAAKNFDHIFTTDADCIPAYEDEAGHQQVFALPFAAQPLIHNPLDEERNGSVCFAGTYYNKRYAERKLDMDTLLSPALDFGLDIYDRNFGKTGKEAELYRFPDIYKESIQGKLDYEEMVKAYKRYKVFLNVNSVRNSPTMFARRVFELLASGTPVISTYSKGIANVLGEDVVFMSDIESETREHLKKLLGDDHFWWKSSLKGLRTVMKGHTYADRTREIFRHAEIPYGDIHQTFFCVISLIKSKAEAVQVTNMLKSQTFRDFELILITDPAGQDPVHLDISEMGADFRITTTTSADGMLESHVLKSGKGTYAAFFHTGCYYGRHYLEDYSNALMWPDAEILGKASYFKNSGGKRSLVNKGSEYKRGVGVPHSTIVISKNALVEARIREFMLPGTFSDVNGNIISIDPYNFMMDVVHSDTKLTAEVDI